MLHERSQPTRHPLHILNLLLHKLLLCLLCAVTSCTEITGSLQRASFNLPDGLAGVIVRLKVAIGALHLIFIIDAPHGSARGRILLARGLAGLPGQALTLVLPILSRVLPPAAQQVLLRVGEG